MTDQAQRLEIATVRAEIGSNITYRFNNDAIDALLIPTDSGDIKNLKQVIADIQQEGADKISFATKIYPTTAAGIASTVNGEIFLVASSDADEIYEVWKNNAGVALDTGKRAISASAVIAATDAAQASADSAQTAAEEATAKVAPFLSPAPTDPSVRGDGSSLQPGDTYFNTAIQAIKVYSLSGWVAANVTGTELTNAINTREPSITPGSEGQYWAGDKNFKTLDKSAVGLGNADDTSDENKPVSTAQQEALDLMATKTSLSDSSVDGGAALIGYSGRTLRSKLLETISIKDKGATGLGSVDEYAAIAAAASAAQSIHVPAGLFRISTSGTLNVDVDFARGAQFTIDSGVTITINGKITAPVSKIFSGAGNVVFGAKVGVALIEWFGARDGTDTDGKAYSKCRDACRSKKVATLFSNSDYNAEAGFDGRVYPDSPIISLPGAAINGTGATNGFVLEPGNYGGKYVLPALAQFPGEALKLRGASLANVELHSIQACGDGIVFQTQAADANSLLDSKVTCHVVSALTGNALLIKCDANLNVQQGNEIYINFATSFNCAVLFFAPSPIVPNWDGFKIVFQAIDPTPAKSGAVGLCAICDGAVPKCVFRVETWFGGFPSNGAFVLGKFNGLDFYANYNESFQNYGAWQLTGVGNRITTGFRGFDASAAALAMTATPNSRASWNGGAPIQHTDLYLQATLTASLAAGATADFYFYHPYASTQKFTVVPADLNGMMVQKIETSANANEIHVQVLNVSGASTASGQTFKLFISVGT